MGKKVYLLLFVLGLSAGVFFALSKARASNPQGEASGGEQPASVYYDEFWQATESLVSSDTGYKTFNPSTHNNSQTAAEFENDSGIWYAKVLPKMIVTKWRVHGHIHFE